MMGRGFLALHFLRANNGANDYQRDLSGKDHRAWEKTRAWFR